MPDYKIVADEHTHITREPYDDGWDRGDAALSLTLRSLHLSAPGYGYVTLDKYLRVESDDVPVGDIAYVVYAKYTTGDTFGYSEVWSACAVKASREAAEEVRAELEQRKDYTVPWNGYFERLHYVEIEPLEVQP